MDNLDSTAPQPIIEEKTPKRYSHDRKNEVKKLIKTGSRESISALVTLFDAEKDPGVRMEVFFGIAHHKLLLTPEALESVLQKGKADDTFQIRMFAHNLLEKLN